jgi:small conductance mechanosensitive channel
MSITAALNGALRTVQGYFQGFLEALPRLLLAALLFWALVALSRRARQKIESKGGRRADSSLPLVLSRLVYFAGLIVGSLIAISVVFPSVDAKSLFQLLGVSSLAIGFAFKDLLQNLLAGILILIYRPFRLKDRVKVKEFEGIVEDIQVRATQMRGDDGKTVLVPNSILYTEVIVVSSAANQGAKGGKAA